MRHEGYLFVISANRNLGGSELRGQNPKSILLRPADALARLMKIIDETNLINYFPAVPIYSERPIKPNPAVKISQQDCVDQSGSDKASISIHFSVFQKRLPLVVLSEDIRKPPCSRQQFSIENSYPRCTSDRVVAKRYESIAHHPVTHNASDGRCHAVACVAVKSRLRAVGFFTDDQRVCKCRMQAEFLWKGSKRSERVAYFFQLRLTSQPDADSSQVAIRDIDAVTLCAHFEWSFRNSSHLDTPKNL